MTIQINLSTREIYIMRFISFGKSIIQEMGRFTDASIINGLEGFGAALDYKDSIRSAFKKIDFSFMDVTNTKRAIQQVQ